MKRKILYVCMSLIFLVPVVPVSAEECNHEWGEWHIFNATCGEKGYKYRYCSKCYAEDEQEIPATGNHVWGEWLLDTEPQCFVNGENKRYCEVCNKIEYTMVSAYNVHAWTAWKTDEKPTCGCEGSASRKCNRCDAEQEKTLPIDPNNHELGEWYTWDEATALHGGKQIRDCECGKKVEYRATTKLKAKVKLAKTKVTIKKDKSYTLKIKTKTYGDKVSKWKTSNKKIATVNKSGKVKAKKKGKAKITVYMKSGVKAACTVKVK